MKKSELTKAKDKLWGLCRDIVREIYPNECYTCRAQDLTGSNRQTGHFITSSICSMELRYDIKNLRQQCFVCNIHKSGNWPAFEARLVKDEGQEYVDELKRRNEATKGGNYGLSWIKQKTEDYQELLKSLT
jgi:hypothetical protein